MRYVKNNFFDGDRQDSYDILTGAWVAKRGGIPPLTDTRPLVMRAVSVFLILFDLTSRREWGGERAWRERKRRES
jgi:hypothetical protein